MTFSPFWCLYPEYPMPSPLFWPRCWSRHHGARGGRGAFLPPNAAHWRGTLATVIHHRPISQRLCRRSCSGRCFRVVDLMLNGTPKLIPVDEQSDVAILFRTHGDKELTQPMRCVR